MSNTIAIVDYGMGNLRSVQKALEKIGENPIITNDHDQIKQADKLILPGVGAFKDAMSNLHKLGLVELLTQEVIGKKKPFLGICLGMQLIAKQSEEFGTTEGLGWIDATILRFPPSDLKIPHVGWNSVNFHQSSPLFDTIPDHKDFYFVHSYYFHSMDTSLTIGMCEYGLPFTCAVQKDNIFATQFHPEKSQNYGLQILQNFAAYKDVLAC